MSTVLESSSIQPKLPIILASGSESRKQILNEAGIIFDVSVSDIDESEIKLKIGSLPHGEQVIHLAKAKAATVRVLLLDESTNQVLRVLHTTAPLGEYSYDHFTGYR